MIGLAIVFICKRENSKPTFIKVIWVLLGLVGLVAIATLIADGKYNELLKNEDESRYTVWPYYASSLTIMSALDSIAHWIFVT